MADKDYSGNKTVDPDYLLLRFFAWRSSTVFEAQDLLAQLTVLCMDLIREGVSPHLTFRRTAQDQWFSFDVVASLRRLSQAGVLVAQMRGDTMYYSYRTDSDSIATTARLLRSHEEHQSVALREALSRVLPGRVDPKLVQVWVENEPADGQPSPDHETVAMAWKRLFAEELDFDQVEFGAFREGSPACAYRMPNGFVVHWDEKPYSAAIYGPRAFVTLLRAKEAAELDLLRRRTAAASLCRLSDLFANRLVEFLGVLLHQENVTDAEVGEAYKRLYTWHRDTVNGAETHGRVSASPAEGLEEVKRGLKEVDACLASVLIRVQNSILRAEKARQEG